MLSRQSKTKKHKLLVLVPLHGWEVGGAIDTKYISNPLTPLQARQTVFIVQVPILSN